MDKIKVFLSSSMTGELNIEREVIKTLFYSNESLKQMFELQIIENNASPDNIEDAYQHLVNKSIIFILLLNKEIREAVLKEYEIAVKNKSRIFCYVKNNLNRSKELQNFIDNTLYKKYTCKAFSNPQELIKFVSDDILSDIINKYPNNINEDLKINTFKNIQVTELYYSRENLSNLLENEDIKKMTVEDLLAFSSLLVNEYGKYKDALIYLEIALLKYPGNWSIYNNKGVILQSMGLIDLAIHSFELSRNFKENDVTLYNLGTLFYEKSEYQKAIIYFNLSLKINPKKYTALSYLTNCYIISGDYAKALELAEQAYSILKTDELIISNLALCYAYNKRNDDALNILENIKDSNKFYYLKTKLLLSKIVEDYKNCLLISNEIINSNYHDYDIYKIKFEALIKLNYKNEAIHLFEDMNKIFAITPSDFNNFGYSLMSTFELYEEAIEYFKKAININPFIIQSWQNLQICYAKLDKYDEVLKTCDETLFYFPSDPITIQNKCASLIKLSEFKDAVNVLFELFPKNFKIGNVDVDLKEFFRNVFYNAGFNFDKLSEYNYIYRNGTAEEKQKLEICFQKLQKNLDDIRDNILSSLNLEKDTPTLPIS